MRTLRPPTALVGRYRRPAVGVCALVAAMAAVFLAGFQGRPSLASPVSSAPAANPGLRLLERAVGGVQAIRPFQVRASGWRAEPLHGLTPSQVVRPSAFTLTGTFDPAGQRERLSWQRTFSTATVAPGQTLSYDEISTAAAGYVEGSDVAYVSSSGHPMTGARLGAVRRQQELLNPVVYLAGVLRQRRAVRFDGTASLGGRTADVVTVSDWPRPVTLYFVNGNLVRLSAEENDFYLGDVKVDADYAHWRTAGSGRYPFEVNLSLDGVVVSHEAITSVSADSAITSATFALPVTARPSAKDIRYGQANEQWFNRVLAYPFGASIQDTGQYPQLARQIAPNVILVYGPQSPNITLAVKTGNSVVVAEPGISSAYSQQVISVIRAHWPGTPISHVIATQFHFDETGGIRQYAATGANLIVPGYVPFFREILTRPHTIDPDLLSTENTRPRITPVGPAGISLGGGAVTVHTFFSTNEARMLLICTRDSHLAFAGDIFNPRLFPANAPAPEPFRTWAGELYHAIKASCPQVTGVLGSHGQPQPEPLSALAANAG